MLKKLRIFNDVISGADDPILKEVMKEFNVSKYLLVWEPIHNGEWTQISMVIPSKGYIKVKLYNKEHFTGTGYVHEYLLMERGWNEADEARKYGIVKKDYQEFSVMEVKFPWFGITCYLCLNEFYAVKE